MNDTPRCGSLTPVDPSRHRCTLPIGHQGVHQSAVHHGGNDWAEVPLPGTERDWLNLPSDRLRERIVTLEAQLRESDDEIIRLFRVVDALIAERDSARDRFIRMEGRHEAAVRGLTQLREDRERLVLDNTQQAEDIAELEHALAEAEDRIADLEDALKGSQEVAAWWLKVATNTAAKRMLRPASTEDGEGR